MAYETKGLVGCAALVVDVREIESAPSNDNFKPPATQYRVPGKPQVAYGFVGIIRRTLASRGLGHDALVTVICANGRNAALVAELLRQASVANVFVVRGGMQGEIGAVVNSTGWITAGLRVRSTSTPAVASK